MANFVPISQTPEKQFNKTVIVCELVVFSDTDCCIFKQFLIFE